MYWFGVYVGVGVLVAIAAPLLARRFRGTSAAAPDRTLPLALLAGLLWPILLIGLAQVGIWVLIRKMGRARAQKSAGDTPARASESHTNVR